ncbi:hypothetical protein EDD15DRAFT_2371164 [Pisolithus albus]|nr:hypothetical protein EDD15DRAFT_2377015 [Pisolithus albus]KAI5988817.1 hypothetical protein EDD15DRAFT_2371164 [Pisolithus albus]
MLFDGGPAMESPRMMVSNELKDSHHDIERASSVTSMLLAKRASNGGRVVDLFAGCLDQLGLLEMKSPPNSTNGVMLSGKPPRAKDQVPSVRRQMINSCVFRSGYSGWHSSGQRHLRVTTIVRNFTTAGSPSIATSLDQEAAAILMVRIAAF